MDFLSKLKVEVAVPTEMADRVAQSARSGKIGDGRILVWDLELAMRIRPARPARGPYKNRYCFAGRIMDPARDQRGELRVFPLGTP